jgi:hypothetical protein
MPQSPDQPPDYNRTGIDFRQPMPRPKIKGAVIDFHCHLLAERHGDAWFEAADHYGIDQFFSMGPLEEAVGIQRRWGDRVQFIAVPAWLDYSPNWYDDWMRRLEGFYNLGSRIVKFHMAPQSMDKRHYRLDSPELVPFFREIEARNMAVMTHVGDPDTWYAAKYTDHERYGTREDHYKMWADALAAHPNIPWVGAHMGGQPRKPAAPPAFSGHLSQPDARLLGHPMDGPRDQRPPRRRPRILYPQQRPHPLRHRPGQRRRPGL